MGGESEDSGSNQVAKGISRKSHAISPVDRGGSKLDGEKVQNNQRIPGHGVKGVIKLPKAD